MAMLILPKSKRCSMKYGWDLRLLLAVADRALFVNDNDEVRVGAALSAPAAEATVHAKDDDAALAGAIFGAARSTQRSRSPALPRPAPLCASFEVNNSYGMLWRQASLVPHASFALLPHFDCL